jgi:DNA-directed RNA polymerase subunit RPC12/RpoP
LNDLSCPYCGSSQARRSEAIYTVRIVARPEGGPGREKKCAVYRCGACGHTFDEIEGEPREDADPWPAE